MSALDCELEDAVLAAVRTGEWTDALRTHAAGCATCGEVALIAGTLLAEARTAESEAPLPDPAQIWLDARKRSRRLALARATRPITVARTVAAACAAGTALLVALQLEPHLAHWFRPFRPTAQGLVTALTVAQGVLLLVAGAGFLVLATYALLTAYREP